jgi:FdhD protein
MSRPEAFHSAAALAVRTVNVERWRDGQIEYFADQVAEEQPVALTYNGIPHVVMLATPAHLDDLARGFTLSEAIVQRPEEIHAIEVFTEEGGLEVRIGIATERFSALLRTRRNLTGRTGCGLCGAETIEQAIRHPAPVTHGIRISSEELHAALEQLHTLQLINAQTGSVHAAAWVLPDLGIQLVREDVGRHNALDKVIGALVRKQVDCSTGYVLITSRASYEVVQKAATLGITVLAAVSAPTALAIKLAEETGMTLLGFARRHSHVVYTHPQRLVV